MLLAFGLGLGLAGGAFAVGMVYVSAWFPREKQGTALGLFGMGNVGAAVTKFLAPFVLVAWGWQGVAELWAAGIALMPPAAGRRVRRAPPARSAVQACMRRRKYAEIAAGLSIDT